MEPSAERLDETRHAPLYPATGPAGILAIMRSGLIKNIHGYIPHVCVSRDPRFCYYGTDTYGEPGVAPFQFVLDGEVVRGKHKVRPFDFKYIPGDDEPMTKRRAEREERIYTSKGIPVDREHVQAIIFEPVTERFLTHATNYDEGYLLDGAIRRSVYYNVERMARERGIPIIDRRSASSR